MIPFVIDNPLPLVKLFGMTYEELHNLHEKIAQEQRENALQQKATDKQLKELGKQIGALGQKFGSFTEGMAFPSMKKLLETKFGMDSISTRFIKRKNGKTMELDVLAYANTRVNEVYIVEVKSHLREDGIEQTKKILQNFYEFFPEHKDKKVFAILATVDVSDDIKEKVLQEGIYLARIHDEQFELDVPEDFVPKAA